MEKHHHSTAISHRQRKHEPWRVATKDSEPDARFEAFLVKRWSNDPVLQDVARAIFYPEHEPKYSARNVRGAVLHRLVRTVTKMRFRRYGY